ncbi:ankyrin repeat-containing domain protein [Aspergillus cavernicola]|uniref:Ankyrin repeat-containing domain protein n=1 Tax=Aspergillus cavernicola TaxID=176166 RepID=A0ABR4IXM6_9EURO
MLLEHGAGPHGMQPTGFPVVAASESGNIEALKLLVGRGVDVQFISDNEDSTLIAASRSGNIEIMEFLMQLGVEVKESRSCHLALWAAAAGNNHIEAVKLLISAGATVDDQGYTSAALLCESKHGYYELAKIPLDAGAYPNDQIRGELPLYIERQDTQGTPIQGTINGSHTEVFKLLLGKGAQTVMSLFSLKADRRETMLHLAVGKNISIAAERGYTDVLRVLVSHKADIHMADKMHRTPLYWVTSKGHVSTIKLLLETGAHVEAGKQDGKPGNSPLFAAVNIGNHEAVNILLGNGANTNTNPRDTRQRTPLIKAASKGDIEVVRSLISWNADMTLADENGRRALACAKHRAQLEIVKLLQGAASQKESL